MDGPELQAFLRDTAPADLAEVILAMAATATEIAERVRSGPPGLGAKVGVNSDGDAQKALDLHADSAFEKALRGCSVRALASEERAEALALTDDGAYLVALDPLDGSSNIEINGAIATLFSLLDADEGFLQPGHRQRAAGLVLYGPQTALTFTTGAGTHGATLNPDSGGFVVTQPHMQIREGQHEFAINMSNRRHWPAPVAAYVEDLLLGAEGPRRQDFNMRWIGAMAADVYRVLQRGGVYLYPDDARPGRGKGRLHLLYEANPAAFLIEQAGGLATDGVNRILDKEIDALHARTPLVFGSVGHVETVRDYYLETSRSASRAPLFGRRGLWRA